jgi:hypothetical protein
MRSTGALVDEIRARIAAPRGLTSDPDHCCCCRVPTTRASGLADQPLLVVMAQGGGFLSSGDQLYDTGQVIVSSPRTSGYPAMDRPDGSAQALGMGLVLRPAAITALLLQAPPGRWSRGTPAVPAMATGKASPELLDAAARMLRLLDHPADAPVLAPLITQEILWRLLAGSLGDTMRQIGLADSDLSHVSRAIAWIRDNYAEPMRIDDLARLSGMARRRFIRTSGNGHSPLRFRSAFVCSTHAPASRPSGDIAASGTVATTAVQFNRYRRLFGAPPGRDAERLRAGTKPLAVERGGHRCRCCGINTSETTVGGASCCGCICALRSGQISGHMPFARSD